MKKFLIMILCALSFTLLFVACGKTTPPDDKDDQKNEQPTTQTITGVTFQGARIQEDGDEHEITVTGTLPEGVSVAYANNKGTLPGTYNATATLSGAGYTTLVLNATLEIYTIDITGVTFTSTRIWEDGNEHEITVTGSLPEGVSVKYENNKGTLPDTYNATATLTGIGYTKLELTATLEIYTIDITGVTFTGKKVLYTGFNHTFEVEGEIPAGVTVDYDGNNVQKEVGIYEVTATLSGYGYNTLVLKATFEIYSLSDVAKSILEDISERPDPWAFLPEGLHKDNMAYTTTPVNDFTRFVQTSTIGTRTIGKQLNVLYDALGYTETVLKYLDFDGALNAITNVYQEYITTHPEDYHFWQGEAGGFRLKITLDDTTSTLLAGNGTVSIELSVNSVTGERYGRIQATGGFVLKYETAENSFKLALRGTVSGVGYSSMVEFLRDEDAQKVAGYVTEFWGTENTDAIKTKALIYADASRTIIMSNKRESDDLLIEGYEEIYNSKTGEMLGGEVTESVKLGSGFDTLWFPMNQVTGITTIKVIHETNGKNLDTIYVNGSANKLETTTVLISQTREFDIEMNDVWYIVKQADGSYEKVKCSVPMLFIQTKYFKDFSADIVSKNKNKTTFDTTPTASTTVYNELSSTFKTMYEVFEVLKEQVTSQDITAYIGTADAFFSKED